MEKSKSLSLIISLIALFFILLTLSFLTYTDSNEEVTQTNIPPSSQVLSDKTDVHINTLTNKEDVINTREKLIEIIWSGNGFSKRLPDKVERDIDDFPYTQLTNSKHLEKVDRLTVNMEFEATSVIYRLHPKKDKDKLILFQNGHGDHFSIAHDERVFNTFLEEGYSIVLFLMPQMGENNFPVFNGERLHIHDRLVNLESNDFNPLKLFVEPIAITINYLETSEGYEEFTLFGISGGGWTTALYAALDERIVRSYQIAGSMPLSIHQGGRDYEQRLPSILNVAGYPTLYVLGSHGNERKQVQILNENDRCCFQGTKYRQQPYADSINNRLKILGSGVFEVAIMNESNHTISKEAVNLILKDNE